MKQNQNYIYESTAKKLKPEVHKQVSRQAKQIKHHKAEGKKNECKICSFSNLCSLCVFFCAYLLSVYTKRSAK